MTDDEQIEKLYYPPNARTKQLSEKYGLDGEHPLYPRPDYRYDKRLSAERGGTGFLPYWHWVASKLSKEDPIKGLT